MKVIFIKDFPPVARAGTVKEVSEGYARNFLFPKGLAEIATAQKVQEFEAAKNQKAEASEKKKQEFLKLENKIRSLVLNFSRKADPAGTLFAGVTAREIALALGDKIKLEFNENWVKLLHPLKKVGDHKVEVEPNHLFKTKVNVVIKAL